MKIIRLILKGIDYIALFFMVCLFWYLLWIICMLTIVPAITAIFMNLKHAPNAIKEQWNNYATLDIGFMASLIWLLLRGAKRRN